MRTEQELELLNDEQLQAILGDMGLEVTGTVPKPGLIKQILSSDQETIGNSQTVSKKAMVRYQKIWDWNKEQNSSLEKEPVMEITFQHMDGDSGIEFAFSGPLGKSFNGKPYMMPHTLIDRRTKDGRKKEAKWLGKAPIWHFINGQKYTVPFSLYQHLNSLLVKDKQTVGETAAGTPITKPVLRRRVIAEHVATADTFKKAV